MGNACCADRRETDEFVVEKDAQTQATTITRKYSIKASDVIEDQPPQEIESQEHNVKEEEAPNSPESRSELFLSEPVLPQLPDPLHEPMYEPLSESVSPQTVSPEPPLVPKLQGTPSPGLPPRRAAGPQTTQAASDTMFGLQIGAQSGQKTAASKVRESLVHSPDTPPPAVSPRGCGAYLTLEWTSGGSMFLIWNKQHVEGAYLFAAPGVQQAEHKFRGGGKSELTRNMQKDKQQFYRGFCDFIKQLRTTNAELEILPAIYHAPLPVKLVFHKPDNSVVEAVCGMKFMLKEYDGVAAVHLNARMYEVGQMESLLFVQTAGPNGYACPLNN